MERLRFRTRRPGAHSRTARLAQPAVLHGELRKEERAHEFPGGLFRPDGRHVRGRLQCLATTIYDPNTLDSSGNKTPFPGNKIPSNRIDPISKKFLNYYASSNLPGFRAIT